MQSFSRILRHRLTLFPVICIKLCHLNQVAQSFFIYHTVVILSPPCRSSLRRAKLHAIMHSFFIITQHYLFSKQKTEPDTQALLILLVLFEKTHAVFIPLCLLRLRRLRLMNRLCKRVRHIVLALLAKSSRADRLPAGLTDNAVCSCHGK